MLHLIHIRMATIKKKENKCWRGCGEFKTLVHCWWGCKTVLALWQTVQWNIFQA